MDVPRTKVNRLGHHDLLKLLDATRASYRSIDQLEGVPRSVLEGQGMLIDLQRTERLIVDRLHERFPEDSKDQMCVLGTDEDVKPSDARMVSTSPVTTEVQFKGQRVAEVVVSSIGNGVCVDVVRATKSQRTRAVFFTGGQEQDGHETIGHRMAPEVENAMMTAVEVYVPQDEDDERSSEAVA